MRSAFKRGIELLSEPESNSVQSRGKPIEGSSKSASENMEGIVGVPKNVTQLHQEKIHLLENGFKVLKMAF